jgi:hypothetical protein
MAVLPEANFSVPPPTGIVIVLPAATLVGVFATSVVTTPVAEVTVALTLDWILLVPAVPPGKRSWVAVAELGMLIALVPAVLSVIALPIPATVPEVPVAPVVNDVPGSKLRVIAPLPPAEYETVPGENVAVLPVGTTTAVLAATVVTAPVEE